MSDTIDAAPPDGGPVSSDPGYAVWLGDTPEGPSRYALPVDNSTQPPGWAAPPPPPRPVQQYPAPPAPPAAAPSKRRRWPVALIAAIVGLGVGIGIGAATASPKTETKNLAGPTVTAPTVIETVPGPTVTAPAPKPAPKPASAVLFDRSGTRTWNSTPFQVGDGPVTVTYSYDGNVMEGESSGDNFSANLASSTDSQLIVNDIAASGGKTTTIYPDTSLDGSHSYHLEVTATGHWHFKIVQG